MNLAFGTWCGTMRQAYSKIQKGQTPRTNLTQDKIKCLEEIGFKWKIAHQCKTIFEQHYRDLESFQSEFGHCDVPSRYSVNPSLGRWCGAMRYSYKQIQHGQTPHMNLTRDKIKLLEEIGFKWTLK